VTRLWVLSDLHLEAARHPEAFHPVRPDFDVLVVAGDIWEGDIGRALHMVARLAASKPAVFVMGNGEHWNAELHMGLATAKDHAEQLGINLLDGNAVDHAGVRFLGGTLWTDGRLSDLDATPAALTGDLIDVTDAGTVRRITFGDAITLHKKTHQALDRMLAASREDCKVVVVTHHAPHPLCLPPDVRDTSAAGVFASDLSRLIEARRPDLWVHGHIHTHIDFTHAGTRIICNAAGPGFTNPDFQEDWVVDV
jgi:Icc-related predicted phosphoesterase